MLIRMRTNFAGPQGTARAGKVIRLPDAQAKELIKGRWAEAVSTRGEAAEEIPLQAPETAAAEIAETESALPPARRRRGRPPNNKPAETGEE